MEHRMTWTGDFNDGTTAGWDHVATASPGAITIVDASDAPAGCPVPQAARIVVGPGEAPGHSYGSRAELIRNPADDYGQPGQITTLAWWHHYDGFAPTAGNNTLVTDLHSTNLTPEIGGGVNVTLRTPLDAPDTLELVLQGGRFEGPIPGGENYHRFALEQGMYAQGVWALADGHGGTLRYAVEHRSTHPLGQWPTDGWAGYVLQALADPAAGWLRLWRDGQLLVDVAAPTLFVTAGAVRGWSLHQGVYRPSEPHGAPSGVWLAGSRMWSVAS
jgi:hypothetical protein